VFPGHAPVLGAGVAEQKRRMERGDQHGRAIRMDLAAELADRLARAEQRLRGDRAEGEDDLRLDHAELRREERRARGKLVRFGVSVAWGPALDGIQNVDRKSTRLNSSHDQISYAVFCLKKKNKTRSVLA